jgi:hypothetical protein
MDKFIAITSNSVLVDGVNVGSVLESKPEEFLYACYFQDVAGIDFFGVPTGQTVRQYFIFNGIGWAQITGIGEAVTIHE